jgi:hypothetical protein
MSFLHARNVELVQPSGKKRKKGKKAKKNRFPFVRFHTLSIDPVSKIYKSAGELAKGHKKAVHLVRGHFKDYRHGKGLFGKHKVRVFCPQHVAGDKKVGIVEKDYEI